MPASGILLPIMANTHYYSKPIRFFPFNIWDGFALLVIFAAFGFFAWGAKQMSLPFQLGQAIPISLDPHMLPSYALQSVLRMLMAMCFSLLFTFIVGGLAAKNKHAERIIIPMVDILQSVPVLGYLSFTYVAFIALFPNSLMGPQCACIFVVFTAQVWNMTLGFYQTLKNIPGDLQEAAAMFHLTGWQKFWRIEVPLAMPSLTWNAMLSMSASWVYLVANEAISVANQNITLPGIGSYISLAVTEANLPAIFYAILTMFIVIMIYDQLLFRPIVAWSQKFRFEQNPNEDIPHSWFAEFLQRAHLKQYLTPFGAWLGNLFINPPWINPQKKMITFHEHPTVNKSLVIGWYVLIGIIVLISLSLAGKFIFSNLPVSEVWITFKLGCATLLRVMSTVIISSLVWIPLGVWVGQRPQYARLVQPTIQFLAGFPMNLVFPIAVIVITYLHLNAEIWVTALMILSCQWYIAFNVIAGTTTLPQDYYYATQNMGVKGWLWWKRFVLPGIFPYYVTGALTAAGGAWNLSILAEVIQWGQTKIAVYGLGAYMTQYTNSGDFHRIALSIVMMCLFVVLINRILWHPLYRLAQDRFGI